MIDAQEVPKLKVCSPNAFSETTTATMMLMMVIACVCAVLLGAGGRSAWKFGGHEWVQHTAHARNHSDGDKKQPTCARKEREERGRNWWHPCSGTTHLGYEEKLNSYGAASLAESPDKPVDMVLKFIYCSFLASMSCCQVARMTQRSFILPRYVH